MCLLRMCVRAISIITSLTSTRCCKQKCLLQSSVFTNFTHPTSHRAPGVVVPTFGTHGISMPRKECRGRHQGGAVQAEHRLNPGLHT